MAMVDEMKLKLRESMKARDSVRTNVLRYWIGQFTLGDGTFLDDDQAIKKMRSVVKEAKTGQTSFSDEEIAIIQEWLPPTLSVETIRERLAEVADKIKAAPQDGPAMGMAMKQLKGEAVEAADVQQVVQEIRQG